jgi:hypothetical protein
LDEVVDPTLVAVAVPLWLWTIPDQPKSAAAPLAQTQAGTVGTATSGSAQSDEPTPATDANVGPLPGAIPEPIPEAVVAALAGPTAQTAPPAIQSDPSTPALGSVGVSTRASPEQEPSPIGASIVAAGSGAGVELQNNVSANQIPATANRADGFDPQRPPTSASTDQNGSAPAVVQNHRAGRAPAAYADAAGLTARAGGLARDRGSMAASAVSSDPATPSGRTTDMARPDDRATAGGARAANVSGPIADAQAAMVGALLANRAQNGTAHNPSGQDSTPAFAEPQPRVDEVLTLAAQALEGTVAAAALHPDHASTLGTGQTTQIGHVPSQDHSLTSAISSLSADRSAAIDDGNLHRQIVRAIQLQSHNGIGDARLTLQPEYLGELTIALRVENGGVTAHVSAAASDVRAWLGANEALLRQGLLEQGLTLDRLIVSDEPDESSRDAGSHRRQQQPEPEEKPRSRQRRDTSTFEITV